MRIAVAFDVRLETSDDEQHNQPGSSACGGQEMSSSLLNCDDAQEEFDSPATIQALAQVLENLGHEVDLLGDGEPMLRRLLQGPRPTWC